MIVAGTLRMSSGEGVEASFRFLKIRVGADEQSASIRFGRGVVNTVQFMPAACCSDSHLKLAIGS